MPCCTQRIHAFWELGTLCHLQIWTPPYLLNGKPRPSITGAPSTLGYASSFSFRFSGVSAIGRVVINRVTSATHGNHFDQRQATICPLPSHSLASALQALQDRRK